VLEGFNGSIFAYGQVYMFVVVVGGGKSRHRWFVKLVYWSCRVLLVVD
jgi:hypothetical protein